MYGGAFVGSVGLWFPEGWPERELGYWLVPEAQGKGYATEAARIARRCAYELLSHGPHGVWRHPGP